RVMITGTGAVVVEADQAGNGDYQAAAVQRTLQGVSTSPSAPPVVAASPAGMGSIQIRNPDGGTHPLPVFPGFAGSIAVATGIVDGDPAVAAAGAGGGSHVQLVDPRTGGVGGDFFAVSPVQGGVARGAAPPGGFG